MKKKLLMILTLLLVFNTTPVYAESNFLKAKATAYCLKGITATGTEPKEGRTVASKPEYFGKTMIIYVDDGDGNIKSENYLGTYIVEDTGAKSVRNGYVVDVYITDYNRAVEFGCVDILYQIVDAEG